MRRLPMMIAMSLGVSCGVDEPVETTAQEVVVPHACFVDAGQPNPSDPMSRRFNASCSTPATGSTIWKYRWDFGDSSSVPLTGNPIIDHVFPFTNTCYKTQLTVIDLNGNTDTTSHNEIFCAVGPCAPVCPP